MGENNVKESIEKTTELSFYSDDSYEYVKVDY